MAGIGNYAKKSKGSRGFNMRSGNGPLQFKQMGSSPNKKDTKTKEQLLKEGFTPRDADQMIKDGAVTGVVNDKKKTNTNKKPVKPSQGDFVPAYPGADISKAEYDKARKAGVKSEAEYTEYKAKQNKTKKLVGKTKKAAQGGTTKFEGKI